MKKLKAICVAFIIFCLSAFGIYIYCCNYIRNSKNAIIYLNSDSRNSCYKAMDNVLDENTALILGSSELFIANGLNETAFPSKVFNNGNSNFNMVLDGRGWMQSIHHVVNVGALSSAIKNDKVVLVLSPQWFTESHMSSERYSSRFFERMYVRFLKNDNISLENKLKTANRIESLLASDPKELDMVKEYGKIYLENSFNPFIRLKIFAYDNFMELNSVYDLSENISKNYTIPEFDINDRVDASKIDYKELMREAEINGKKNCKTNRFGVFDDYFNTYIKDKIKERKNSSKNSSYVESPEYSDLCLFLDICKELNIDPLLVMVPVNGRWYDYIGFPKEGRNGYYEKIRNISKDYGVRLADFSDKEYEKYFLRDIMHLGWKGWVNLDEAVYKFYKKQ